MDATSQLLLLARRERWPTAPVERLWAEAEAETKRGEAAPPALFDTLLVAALEGLEAGAHRRFLASEAFVTYAALQVRLWQYAFPYARPLRLMGVSTAAAALRSITRSGMAS